ncbi:hypothetical protein NVV93_16360 [Pseudomonas sp. LS44]|uniref:hypothetical protein n=1 Tax=Pseudomonas sp. LS44 TaxID=1357074 RepID=UPI00215A372A|nr:hypothetical protein [Pseudomonas sp. LS44]UVE17140.1 hypothetical protein NVV93_16360 [Pseudomonas sp. LS44]
MAFKLHTFDSIAAPRQIALMNERLSRLQLQFEAVDKRIFRLENGIEREENLSLAALMLHRSGLREDIERLLARPSLSKKSQFTASAMTSTR